MAVAHLKMKKFLIHVLQIFLIFSPACAAATTARAFRSSRNLETPKLRRNLLWTVVHRKTSAITTATATATTTTITSIRGGSSYVARENPNQIINRYETVIEPSTFLYNQTAVEIGSTDISSLLHQLSTSTTEGLTSQEASTRLSYYGSNVLETPPSKSLLMLILEQFDDKLVQILLCVAAISGIFSFMEMRSHSLATGESHHLLKSFIEPADVILAILFLNAAVGVWQSRQAEGSLEALKKLQPSLTCVLRDGKWMDNMEAKDLVPGDVIRIRVGDKVPADARVLSLESSVLNLDEGSLTGESVTVEKVPGDEGLCRRGAPVQDMKSVLFSGTVCTAGSALAVVVRTGMATEMGKIQKGVTEAKADEHKTPLGMKLDEFGNQLTKIIGFICLGVWMVSIPKFTDPTFKNPLEGAVYYAKVAVALGVAAIPEGLPAVITLCLSLGTRRMAKRNVIVRKLPSVETLGCTSVICTDKTGTLTTNEMTAVSLVVFEKEHEIAEHKIIGSSYSPVGYVEGIKPHEEICSKPRGSISDIAAVSALCNDAKIIGHDKHADDEKIYERVGEPTEAALCILAEKLGGSSDIVDDYAKLLPSVLASMNVDGWRSKFLRTATLEFNRDRKSMSVLCRPMEGGRGNRLLVKGAPNLLIKRCTHVKFRDGTVSKLTGEMRRMIEAKTSELATRPLRCLALAVKETEYLDKSLKNHSPDDSEGTGDAARKHPLLSDPSKYTDIESGLTLVGVVGIKDPARPEVAESILSCTEAGIRVIMITGDAKDTATAIARDVNIFSKSQGEQIKAFEGREFFEKPEYEQLELLKSGNIVFCRAEPSDKQKLVKMLQNHGEISAMTGDGVNDAPALQQADIGVAMGITGTEVSKEAADMILVDDNFSTIVNAIEEGRCIYANMQAFICFLISCNIGEICAILLSTLSGVPEPLTAMHLLWVNLVTDGPPATALGFNPPVPDLMKQPPRPRDEPIMTPWLLTRYCLTGLYVGIATVGIFIGHYLERGLTLRQLSAWGKCGQFWSPSDPNTSCADLFTGHGRLLPQSLSLTTLVCMEMLKALAAVSVDKSIFTVGPHKNPLLILGVTVPMALHLFVLYSSKFGFPRLGDSFGMVPLSRQNWISVLKWSAPIILVEEILK
eukprot:CAMPEP_0176481274 /NCGR_PEP_ID=MMETSP0200_2-20121128/2730_1 /TAXON_ID=947934 /ORGANISM="Chaetoceros sp., Strain GSL56" /LENGTH=1135 /DNA_ID=CAMNT_0017877463 /DNA_START=117 /DNA_END=3522 /DNA_ORIENTATION=+